MPLFTSLQWNIALAISRQSGEASNFRSGLFSIFCQFSPQVNTSICRQVSTCFFVPVSGYRLLGLQFLPLQVVPRQAFCFAMRILIADDHDVVRKGICSILAERKDLEICGEAADGREAMEQASQTRPDVIILDISMPRLDGFAAAREIRKFLPHVPIVFLSMHTGSGVIDQAKLAGAQGYVKKMQAGSDLLQAVDAVLQNKTFFPSDQPEHASS
jgi:CheY-like chemotaxis protein